MLIGVPGSVG